MKVALVCDWLTNVGGAEKVLLEIHNLYPDAPIFTSKYDPKGIDWFKDADVRTGWLQAFPVWTRRIMGPFRQHYFSHLDLSEYDLIISVTGAEAKSVKSGKWLHEHKKKSANPKGIHISYCHMPTQYYWQMYDEYIRNPGFGVLNPFVRFFFKIFVRPLRSADFKAAQRPEYYITISEYAKEAFKKCYGRKATVINPAVEVANFKKTCGKPVENYYITTSRQVNWKRIDLAVKACLMTQRKLMVVGDGSEHERLVRLAKGSGLIEFVPVVGKEKLAKLLASAKGYLFPSMEPFGIAPVEAMASGCPVIAFKEGGAQDYVKAGVNGIFFEEQTATSLAEAILKFEKMKFNRKKISESVDNFSVKRFDKEIRNFVNEKTK